MTKIPLLLVEDNRLLREGLTGMHKKAIVAILSDGEFFAKDASRVNGYGSQQLPR
jgi:hypothetical protein